MAIVDKYIYMYIYRLPIDYWHVNFIYEIWTQHDESAIYILTYTIVAHPIIKWMVHPCSSFSWSSVILFRILEAPMALTIHTTLTLLLPKHQEFCIWLVHIVHFHGWISCLFSPTKWCYIPSLLTSSLLHSSMSILVGGTCNKLRENKS